jgi:membrane protein DedA with SNARE-associated domain
MISVASVLLSWLLLYKYALLFGVFFLSALALPLPGNTLLLASGAFASQGYMNYWFVLSTVLVGNVLGDMVGYVLAAYYGERIVHRLRIKRSHLDAMQRYVVRHPRTTIFLSRFGGMLDPAVNILCGLGEVSFKTFFVFDLLGNLASLGAVLTMGYYLGDYWQSFSGLIATVGWIIFAVLATLALLLIFRRQLKRSPAGIAGYLRSLRTSVTKGSSE